MSAVRVYFARAVEGLRDSCYVKWVKNNKGLILACTMISVFLCTLTYPGIIYSDSYIRISMTSGLKMAMHAFLDGNADLTEMSSWITVIPSFFILLSKEIIGSIILYTFVQCFLMFLCSYAFGMNLSGYKYKAWNIACITLTPTLWAYGVYYEAGIGCATAIMAIMLIIWKYDAITNMADKILSIIILLLASFVCFGYRANAFTILPPLLVIIFIKFRKKIKGWILVSAICAGIVLTSVIPKALNIDTMSSFAASFVWEIVSTIQTMDKDKRTEYVDYLDDIFGDGSTQSAIDNSIFAEQEASINPLFGSMPTTIISEPGNSERILRKYADLIKNEPKAFLKTKWEFVSHTLGIGKSLNFIEYEYNRWNSMSQLGFNDCEQRKVFVEFNSAYMGFMQVFRMPWFMFLAALVLLILHRFLKKEKKESITLGEASFLIAVFYYGAYVLNTQSFEFRYFFPSWILLLLVIISSIADIVWERKKGKEILLTAGCVLTIFCMFGAYGTYVKIGDDMIAEAESRGIELYADEQNRVYYLESKLYFIATDHADTQYTYFLHYFPSEGDIINNDFSYRSKKIVSSWWKNDVAVMDLPKQALNSLEFGQYYEETRFWETSVSADSFMSCPRNIKVSDYSDADWTRGYSKTENCLLLEDQDVRNYLLKGKGLRLADGTVVRITEVTEMGDYLKIYTDTRVEDMNNRKMRVVK